MKAPRITGNGQFVQDINLPPGTYTYNALVKAETGYYYFRLLTAGGAQAVFSSVVTPNEWTKVEVTINLSATYTKFDLSYYTNSPVMVAAPMFEHGTNASTAAPHPDDVDEELHELEGDIIEMGTELTQTKEQIQLLATKTVQIEGDISEMEGALTVQAGQISGKVSQTDFNALGERVGEAEGALTVQANKITALVTREDEQDDLIAGLQVSTENISLEIDNLNDDLEATGIDIDLKKITVTAPQFVVKQPNGNPVAVFNENILLDDYGNFRMKSLRTPFVLHESWNTVNFENTPSVILTNFTGSGDLVLPAGEKYNGIHVNIIWDMFFNTEIAETAILFRLKPAGSGKIFSDQGTRDDHIRLSTHERVYIGLLGYWANGVLNWIVTDKVNRSTVPPSFKAGDTVYSAYIWGSSAYVLSNKIKGLPSIVTVSSNIVNVAFPTIFVLSDSNTQVARIINDTLVMVTTEADSYSFPRLVSKDSYKFMIKEISRANIANSTAAAVSPQFRFSLVAIKDFSQLYENL